MCGRFTIISDPLAYQMEFDIRLDEDAGKDWKPRYNVSPAQAVPVVSCLQERRLDWMQWGIIPAWAKDKRESNRLINVRSETIMEKVTFRRLMQTGQRCILLADGFYEWQPAQQKGAVKIPFYFQLNGGKPFAFAGLWDNSQTPDGQSTRTCAIITCAPNALVGAIHNRMPVILEPALVWEWLSQNPISALLPLLKPFPAEKMNSFAVSPLVNNPAADRPECILPLER